MIALCAQFKFESEKIEGLGTGYGGLIWYANIGLPFLCLIGANISFVLLFFWSLIISDLENERPANMAAATPYET